MKSILLITILSMVLFTTTFLTCRKNDCINNRYSFGLGVKAYPDYDSINVGDTIFLEINQPVSILELVSGKIVFYPGAVNLGTALSIGQMLGSSSERYAISDFQFILLRGREIQSVDPNRFKEFLFAEEGGHYLFKLAIITQQIGIYRLGISNASNVYTKGNPCDRSNFGISFTQTNQHLYFNHWNFGVSPPLPNGIYCFKVK